LFNKHTTSPAIGFDAKTISYTTSAFASTVILLVGILWYWRCVEPFSKKLFFIGIAGSILDTMGKSFIVSAYSKGPAGPVSACVELNNILLVIGESIRNRVAPTKLEIIGFFLGIGGGMVFSIPD